MTRLLIVFGTTDGHTRRVVAAVAKAAREQLVSVDLLEAADAMDARPLAYDGVIVAASMHAGGFQRAVLRWVRAHASALNVMPTMFLAVCLAVLQRQPSVRADLDRRRDRFLAQAGWRPTRSSYVAGAVPYTRYGWIKKRVMRIQCRRAGVETDITRDYEYTDWDELRHVTTAFLARLVPRPDLTLLPG